MKRYKGKKMQTVTYTLPDFWALALIYDDATGLSDEEHEQLNEWLLAYAPGFCVSVSDDREFTKWHDARDYGVLACDCLEFTFQSA